MSISYSKYKDVDLYHALRGKHEMAEGAFAEIYARYAQRVYAYCFRALGNSEDAMDAFQESFLKFYDSTKTYKTMDNISAFLLVTARNLCINHKRNLRNNVVFEDYKMMINDENYDQKEMLELIASALELLDFEHKEAFILRNYQGLSYKEIADITNSSISAIKNRVWRAKEKIREVLQPFLEDMSN